jgi:uncharacterized protein YraI
MKRSIALITLLVAASAAAVLVLWPHHSNAQPASDIVTLNNATPRIDAVINTTQDTTGAVALQLNQASVTITNSAGTVVFKSTDARIHSLEFRFAPNAGTHTVTVERLPGVNQAYVKVISQADLTDLGTATLVSDSTVTDQQQYDLPLNASSPSSTININIPDGLTDAITAAFPGAPVTAQIVDSSGITLASLSGGQIDAIRVGLDSGAYRMMLLNVNPVQGTVANVSVLPAPQSDLAALASAQTTTVSDNAQTVQTGVCTDTVTASATDLRSGPGSGYDVVAYGFSGAQLQVAGMNTDGSWLVVNTPIGSAWISNRAGTLSGSCSNLTVYDLPSRAASDSETVVQAPASGFGGENEEHHRNGEHEDEDD